MKLKKIAAFDNYILANISLGLLKQNGILCSLQDENTVLADPLLSNAIGGIKLMVAQHQIKEAKQLLLEAENVYLRQVTCKYCKTNSIEKKENIIIPINFWNRIKNQLLYGQPNNYSRKYVCSNCGHIYNELPANNYDF